MLPNRIAKTTVREVLTESWLRLNGFILTFWISTVISILIVTCFYLPIIANNAPEILTNFFLKPFALQSQQVVKWLYLLASLISSFFFMGLKLQAVNNMQNKSAEIKQLFVVLKKPLSLTLVALLFNLTNILLLFNVPFLLLVPIFLILFIILSFLQFTDTLIIQQHLNIMAACQRSFSAVKENFWLIVGCNLAVVAILVLIFFIFLIHIRFWTLILFLIGLMLLCPFAANTYGYLYKKIFMDEKTN